MQGLIEAYWNVNTVLFIVGVICGVGLIEAYWNVNAQPIIEIESQGYGFNRSILKCKS